MVDKDFTSNSLAFIYYYLFVDQNLTPIRMIRCFLTSVYIFYQNEHSPLMQYIDPKPKIIENKETREYTSLKFNDMFKEDYLEFLCNICDVEKIDFKSINQS